MANHSAPLDSLYQALADPTRRAVVARLAEGPASVSELAAPHDMALPSFLRHLKVLEETGLVTSKKTGRVRTCRIAPERMTAAEDWLAERRAALEAQTDRLQQFLEAKKDLS